MRKIKFLPYIEIKKEFSLGEVIFWPFWKLKSRRIKDKIVLKYLEWYFKKWRDILYGKRLNITVVSLKDKLLGPYSKEESEKIRVASNILFLLSAPKNNQIYALSSDNFTVYSKNFKEENRGLVLTTGSYLIKDLIISTKMVNKIKFYKPEYIPSTKSNFQPWFSNKKYYRAIQKAFNKACSSEWFIRFKRSLETFMSSYSNEYSISYFNRIVLLVTSVETLLDLETSSSSKFAEAVKSILGFNNLVCEREKSFALTNRKIRKFAEKLYKVRSRYVHGDEMNENDIRHPEFGEYYKTGVLLYHELVRALLEKNNCLRKRNLLEKQIHLDWSLFHYIEENQDTN